MHWQPLFVLNSVLNALYAGLLSHDVDADDNKPTRPYKATNFFGGDDDKSLR